VPSSIPHRVIFLSLCSRKEKPYENGFSFFMFIPGFDKCNSLQVTAYLPAIIDRGAAQKLVRRYIAIRLELM